MPRWTISELVSGSALLSLAGASLSLIYETVFLRTIGIDIAVLGLTPQDYTTSLSSWAPWVLCVTVGSFVMESINTAIEGGRTEEQIISESANPTRTRRLRNSPAWFISAIIAIRFIMVLLGFPQSQSEFYYLLFLAWVCFIGWLFLIPGVIQKFGKSPLIIYTLGICTLLVCARAASNAEKILKRDQKDIIISKDGDQIACTLIKEYSDKCVYITDNHFNSIPIQEIKAISYNYTTGEP